MQVMRALPFLLVVALVACDHEHGHGEDHSHLNMDAHAHAHAPKYGGRLVELGAHEFQVELLLYPEDGKLEAYMWDGHVEVPVPCAMKSLRIEGKSGAESFTVELLPAKNPYGDETPGKSTIFSGQHDALKGAHAFDGKLVEITLADKTFSGVAFEYTELGAHDHGHDENDDHEHVHEHG